MEEAEAEELLDVEEKSIHYLQVLKLPARRWHTPNPV
jgi:hypothetical protein